MASIIIKNNTNTILTIDDLGVVIPPNDSIDIYNFTDTVELAKSNDIITLISTNTITINDGLQDLNKSSAIRYITGHTIAAVTDVSGKIRVHQTSRKLGLRICWTGQGDGQESVTQIGGGEIMKIKRKVGEEHIQSLYVDFNMVENETFVHEGYVTWQNCQMDTLSLSMVSRVTTTQPGSNTNYNLYGGYMIIPAEGNGTIDITTDITHPNNGMIYMPNNDLQEKPTAFWNADYNTVTKLYENITPAPSGNGRYNMFSIEVSFAQFLRKMPLLGEGFLNLHSSDTDKLGHGMRLKMETDCDDDASHDFNIACLMCLHRQRSV